MGFRSPYGKFKKIIIQNEGGRGFGPSPLFTYFVYF